MYGDIMKNKYKFMCHFCIPLVIFVIGNYLKFISRSIVWPKDNNILRKFDVTI